MYQRAPAAMLEDVEVVRSEEIMRDRAGTTEPETGTETEMA